MTHILIVDDKEENLYYLQALLAGHGCAVDTARHGAEALVKARQRPPDVVISDLLMPVMDGYTLLRHWKADGQLKKIPFIVYTATYTKAEDEQLALSLGADAFILKPSEPEDFLARLHEVQARGAAFTPAMPKHPVGGEQAILKLYSETLIRKLEDKTLRLEEANLALQADITERKLAQKTANLLAAIVESSDNAIIGKDLDGNIQSWNGSAEKIFGYSAAEMLGGPIARLVPPEHLEEESQILEKIRRGESVRHFDTVRLAKDGRRIDVSVTISPIRDSTGQIVGASKVARDITERKRAEETLRRTNRELRAVSDCNQVLVRAEDENKLLQDICRIVCEKAGYRMAWVGYAVQDEGKTVRPVAWAGAEDQYLASAAVSWADTERGRGPVGAAIRTGTTTYIRDFASDSRAAPWREAALQRGFHCNIALPLKDENGHPFGALTIYSSEANSFTPDEIRLLEELAGDLAFGITTLRLRVERKRSAGGVDFKNSFARSAIRFHAGWNFGGGHARKKSHSKPAVSRSVRGAGRNWQRERRHQNVAARCEPDEEPPAIQGARGLPLCASGRIWSRGNRVGGRKSLRPLFRAGPRQGWRTLRKNLGFSRHHRAAAHRRSVAGKQRSVSRI